jgi:2-iminobutanoate/2-iminopropanoate deaminase
MYHRFASSTIRRVSTDSRVRFPLPLSRSFSSSSSSSSSSPPLIAQPALLVGLAIGTLVGVYLGPHYLSPESLSHAPSAPLKEVVSSPDAPGAIGPYSQGIKANGFLFVSGCIGLDPKTGALVSGGLVPQTEQSLSNLVSILKAGGCDTNSVVKTTVLVADIKDYAQVNKLYSETFKDKPYPARAAFAVKDLPAGALVEIEAVAVLNK